jgi:hypothetical protein
MAADTDEITNTEASSLNLCALDKSPISAAEVDNFVILTIGGGYLAMETGYIEVIQNEVVGGVSTNAYSTGKVESAPSDLRFLACAICNRRRYLLGS